jgi:nickel superoxide dismutase
MKRIAPVVVVMTLASFVVSAVVYAHCEVPCGIYGDQRRFEQMLEDGETIAKAIDQINELSTKDDALSRNQLARYRFLRSDRFAKRFSDVWVYHVDA